MKDVSKERCCRKCQCIQPSKNFHSNDTYGGSAYSYCKSCISIYGKKKYQSKREAILFNYQERKRRVFKAYGGKCACCGESIEQFLTIEHSFKDGKKHRENFGFGGGVYRDLEKRSFPKNEGIEINCMNCNWAKRHGNNCPHQGRD